MARKNSEIFLKDNVPGRCDDNCASPVHEVGKKTESSKTLFSPLTHADLDKITSEDSNSSYRKKKISQIGSAKSWSPAKTNFVKEPISNVIKCLIDEKLILSDHDYAAVPRVCNSREENIPNTSKATSEEQKEKHKTKSLNENENDLVGQIIQNMDKMKPDVISHLITAVRQDGSSNADNRDQGLDETKNNVFFKASHKYQFKNFKLSNNIVLQKENKSSNQKKPDSFKELHNRHHQNITSSIFSRQNPASRRYKSKKLHCFFCKSRINTNNKFCLKCKRTGEEFPLLKQAQKEMLFLTCRSSSAPKQRAHLAALEKFNSENSGNVGASGERHLPFPPESKNHRCDFREKSSACDKNRTLGSSSVKSKALVVKEVRKITSVNKDRVKLKTKENKSSDINRVLASKKEKFTEEGKVKYQSVRKRLIFHEPHRKSVNKTEGRFIEQGEIKQKPKNSLKFKKKPQIRKIDSDDTIEDSDSDFDPVKNVNNSNVTDIGNKLCRKSATTERNIGKNGNSTAGNKKLKSVDKDVPESVSNVNIPSIKRKHKSSNTDRIKKWKKMVSVNSDDSLVEEVTNDINVVLVKSSENTSSHWKVAKKSVTTEVDLKREQRCHKSKHKKENKQSSPNNSEDSLSSEADSLKNSKNKNISYSDHEMEQESSRCSVIKPSSKQKLVKTAHKWHVPHQKKKKVKMLASDSDDSSVFELDPDDFSDVVRLKNADKNILVDSESNCRSPELNGPINIVTYVVDKDSKVKVIPDLINEKQKCSNEDKKHLQGFSETNNNSSKELVEHISSPECSDQPCMSSTDQTNDSSSNEDEHFDSCETISKADRTDRSSEIICLNLDDSTDSHKSNHSVLDTHLDNQPCMSSTDQANDSSSDEDDSCETISKADRTDRSSEIICLNSGDDTDNHKSNHSVLETHLDNHETLVETAVLESFASKKTDEIEVPICTSSSQKQLMRKNTSGSDPLEGCVKSRSSEIDVIDLSPCPSPSKKMVEEDTQKLHISEPCAGPAFCLNQTSEKNLSSHPGPLKDLVSYNKCKSDASEECIQFSSCIDKSSEDNTSPVESGRRVILTNINETVPSYLGDSVCIKKEKLETEKTSDVIHSQNVDAFTDADPEDFQDQFCYKKLSDGLYLMGLPGQMDEKNTSQKVVSNPTPQSTSQLASSLTEVKHNSCSLQGQEQEYQFSYKQVGEGLTLMYLPDKESEGENEISVEECPVSKLPRTEELDHNQEVICLSDDSCIELSDDDDDKVETPTNNMNAPVKISTDNIVHTYDAPVKVEPSVVIKTEVNDDDQNSSSFHANAQDSSQKESSFICDVPVLQISDVFSIPDWDAEVENHDVKSDSAAKDVKTVESEIAVIADKSSLVEASASSEGQYNVQDECNSFQDDRGSDCDSEKTKLEVQDETKEVDVLLKEIVNEDQCFFNAVSELDCVTSASIIDLKLRSTCYSSAIGKAKSYVYEELQQLLNSGEQVSSEKLQAKITKLRALELLCQKESQKSTRDTQENILYYCNQRNGDNCELETTESAETQSFGDEPVVMETSEINEEQDSEVVILSPETSVTGLTSQGNGNQSCLSMLLSRPLDSDKSTFVSSFTDCNNYSELFTDCNNHSEPRVYGLQVDSRQNVPSQKPVNDSLIHLSANSTPVVPPQCNTNTPVAQVADAVSSYRTTMLADAVQPHNASSHSNVTLPDSVGQLPATMFRDETVHPPPPYSLQHYNISHALNYYSSAAAVSQVYPSASAGFISQVQELGESDVTFCVMCPKVATAVCKSCTRVAYCGEACAMKYWNEVHHKVCMKL